MYSMLLWTSAAFAGEGANFLPDDGSGFRRVQAILGLICLWGIAYLLSSDRKHIVWRPVLWGIALQLILGALVLSHTVSGFFFTVVDTGVNQLISFAGDGANFVFQSVQPHMIKGPDGTETMYVGTGNGMSPPIKTFAFWVLTTIVFISSLMSVLYYLGVMQVIVKAIAKVMVRTMGTSGAESLSGAGNIFVGQTEAPLLIKPFVGDMTKSELMAVMTGGFATVSGGIMGAYVSFLQDVPNIAGHLVMASIMAAPAALAVAKMTLPEREIPLTRGKLEMPKADPKDMPKNVIEAAARGASDGMQLAINVAAMLIAIVGLIAMADWMISFVPVSVCDGWLAAGYECAANAEHAPLSFMAILGRVFAPIAFLMGIPWAEAQVVGKLLGEKIVFTELLAYIDLGKIIDGPVALLSERSALITSYALCGFANFASIGIQLGGIGGIAPHRMSDLASLGVRAMFNGVLVGCMTGAVVAIYL